MSPPVDEADRSLIARAGRTLADGDPGDARVAALAAGEGIDFATGALYRRVRNDARRARFISRIESGDALSPPREKPRVVVMPGAFAREYPHTGADGSRVFDLAAQLGWPADETFETLVMPVVRRPNVPAGGYVRKNTNREPGDIVDGLNRNGPRYQFSPAWTRDELDRVGGTETSARPTFITPRHGGTRSEAAWPCGTSGRSSRSSSADTPGRWSSRGR